MNNDLNEILEGKIRVNEKIIQSNVHIYLEEKLRTKIIEEGISNNYPELQKHTYLLIDDLKQAIIENNNGLFDKLKEKINKETFIQDIVNDFIIKFDKCKNNVDIYKLIFDKEEKNISMKKYGLNSIEYYNILNHINPLKNNLRIIKEKKIEDSSILKESEFPDFAVYLNGIPFIAIELKTLESGYKKAMSDYSNKKTYHKFLACIGSDTITSFISMNIRTSPYIWASYGDNIKESGIKDILLELVCNKENLLFYFEYCCVIKKDSKKEYVQNARVQQYYVLKKYNEIFKSEINKLNLNIDVDIIKNYFKHHTRTGKTFSIRLIINLLSKKSHNGIAYSSLFENIIVMTHDIVVLENMDKEFSNFMFGNQYGKHIKINSREEYQDSLKKIKEGKKNIYVMNMQKMKLPDFVLVDDMKQRNVNNINYTKKILFIIDEVHTHQNMDNGYAYVRNAMFPNASYITATATPIYKEVSKGQIWNETKEIFGNEIDNFTPNDAKRLKIVTDLIYYKFKWTSSKKDKNDFIILKEKILRLDQLSKEKSELHVFNSEEIKYNISQKLYEYLMLNKQNDVSKIKDLKSFLDEFIFEYDYINNSLENEEIYLEYITKNILDEIILITREKIKKEILNVFDKQKIELEKELKKELMPHKLDIISEDLKKLRESLSFKAKAFWIVGSVKEGLSIIKKIREKTNNNQNIYNDIRFGLDVSNLGDLSINIEKEDLDYFKENSTKIKEINGSYVKESTNTKRQSHALVDFEETTKGSIDVLIIVGKYLMGYDLDILTKVYIDTNINDPKRIIQIATRGSTIREGKDTSFVLDLNINNDTKNLYFKAMNLFNNEGDYEDFSLDNETIDENLNNLNNHFASIIQFFNKQNKLLNEYDGQNRFINYIENKETLLQNKIENSFVYTLITISNYLSKEEINNEINFNLYWDYISKINNILKTLKVPKYYITSDDENYLPYIEKIMNINKLFFIKILYKEQNDLLYFSNEEIKDLIKDTFNLLSIEFEEKIENVNDIFHLTSKDNLISNEIEINSIEKISSLHSLSLKLKEQNFDFEILSNLNDIINELEKNSNEVLEKNKTNEFLEKVKQEYLIKKLSVEKDFNNSLNYYIIFTELNILCKDNNINMYYDLLKKVSFSLKEELERILKLKINLSNTYSLDKLNKEDIKQDIFDKMDFGDFVDKYVNAKKIQTQEYEVISKNGFIDLFIKENFKDYFYNILNKIFTQVKIYDFYYQ